MENLHFINFNKRAHSLKCVEKISKVLFLCFSYPYSPSIQYQLQLHLHFLDLINFPLSFAGLTSLNSLRLRKMLTFGYLWLLLLTFPYLPYLSLPFLTFPCLSLPFLTFPYISLHFITFHHHCETPPCFVGG